MTTKRTIHSKSTDSRPRIRYCGHFQRYSIAFFLDEGMDIRKDNHRNIVVRHGYIEIGKSWVRLSKIGIGLVCVPTDANCAAAAAATIDGNRWGRSVLNRISNLAAKPERLFAGIAAFRINSRITSFPVLRIARERFFVCLFWLLFSPWSMQ